MARLSRTFGAVRRTVAKRWRESKCSNEHGGALAFVLIIGVALLFIAMLGMSVSLSGRRAAAQSVLRRAAFFCAEAGFERSRLAMLAQTNLSTYLAGWTQISLPPSNAFIFPLDTACPPTPLGPSNMTFSSFVRDNVDEVGVASNPAVDTDNAVIIDVTARLGGIEMARVSAMVCGVPGTDLLRDTGESAADATGTGQKMRVGAAAACGP